MSNTSRHEDFDAEQLKQIDLVIDKFREKPGALIPVLEEIQDITGYLPEDIQRHVAFGLDVPVGNVYGVVTFYSFFTMKPRGRHQIRVCTGTACHVRGSNPLIKAIRNVLGIEPGEVTFDLKFSLDTVRCLGCCALAPAMVVGSDIHKQVKIEKIQEILKKYD